MSILDVRNLSQGFSDKSLYKNAAFSIQKGEHVGVVGQNGVGKSTLLDILLGHTTPDSGAIRWQPGIKLGYLDQHAGVDGAASIEAYLHTAFTPLYEKEAEMQALYAGAAAGEAGALEKAAALQEALQRQGLYETDNRLRQVAAGLGLAALGMGTPLGQLSGGQRAKAILAKLLLSSADVLLLDEPTNFLDRPHIDWLCGWLNGLEGTTVVVSHDAGFLRRTATAMLDIEFGDIRKYSCGYDDFLAQKGHLREDYLRRYGAQQRFIQQTEAYIRKNIAGVNTKNARGRRTRLEKMERLAAPQFAERPVFTLGPAALPAAVALEAGALEIGYGAPLLPPLHLRMAGGEKLVVTGFNGVGKTTLVKTLVGQLPPLGGGFAFAPQTKIAYFSQDISWPAGGATPLQVVQGACPGQSNRQARQALARCGVKAGHMAQPVHTLSGGEQSRVKLCLLTLARGNFLILDEPTNHLDAEARQVLQQQLAQFGGCVLLVSHDKAFYAGWADREITIG